LKIYQLQQNATYLLHSKQHTNTYENSNLYTIQQVYQQMSTHK